MRILILVLLTTLTFGAMLVVSAQPNQGMQLVGSISTPSLADRVIKSDHYAYLSIYHQTSLPIYDITYPEQITLANTIRFSSETRLVAVRDTLAFFSYNSGFKIYSISNPVLPSLVSEYYTGSQPGHIKFHGNTAYVVTFSPATIFAIDISQPQRLTLLGTFIDFSSPREFEIADTLLYVIDQMSSSIKVVNIANPAHMTLAGNIVSRSRATFLTIHGQYLYIADDWQGLTIMRLTNPVSPTLVGFHATPVPAQQIAVQGNIAYIACHTNGVYLFDISNPASPRITGFYDTPGRAWGVYPEGDLLYVADDWFLEVYNCIDTTKIDDSRSTSIVNLSSLLSTYPNPFNGSTTLRYSLPKQGDVSLVLFDQTGRCAEVLFSGYRPPGTFEYKLNGHRLASGTYFVRLNSNQQEITTKINLVK